MFDDHTTTSATGEISPEPTGRLPEPRSNEMPLSDEDIAANAVVLAMILANRRVTSATLADHPEVASYYRPELNGGIPANRIPRLLDVDVVWCCEAIPGETHRWKAMPQNFTRTMLKAAVSPVPSISNGQTVRGRRSRAAGLRALGLSPTPGCPGCSGRMATEVNNLKSAFPEVSLYWDFELNPFGPELYLPRSESEVHWIDPDSGRLSKASIVSRTQHNQIGTNRQDCGLEASETNNLALLYPALAARLVSAEDGTPVDPSEVSPQSNLTMVWRCSDPRHPDFKAKVDAMMRAEKDGSKTQGCGACRSFVLVPGCSLADLHPFIAADYERAGTNPVPASEVIPGTTATADFACGTCGYRWSTAVCQRTRAGQGCPACFGSAVTPTNNLAVRYPELLEEWHLDNTIQPTELRPASTQLVLWSCKKNRSHVWWAKPADRTRKDFGTGCPHCDSSGVSKWQVEFFSALKEECPTLEYETEDEKPDACRLQGTSFVFDAFLPEHRIAFEYDGYFWHLEPKHLDRDRRKNAEAEAQGITVIRIRLGLDAIGAYDITVGKRPDLALWIPLLLAQVRKVIKLRKGQK